MVNCEIEPTFHKNHSLDEYLSYLQGRRTRVMAGAVATCNAIRDIPERKIQAHVFLLFNALSYLPVTTKGGYEESRIAFDEGYAALERKFDNVSTKKKKDPSLPWWKIYTSC